MPATAIILVRQAAEKHRDDLKIEEWFGSMRIMQELLETKSMSHQQDSLNTSFDSETAFRNESFWSHYFKQIEKSSKQISPSTQKEPKSKKWYRFPIPYQRVIGYYDSGTEAFEIRLCIKHLQEDLRKYRRFQSTLLRTCVRRNHRTKSKNQEWLGFVIVSQQLASDRQIFETVIGRALELSVGSLGEVDELGRQSRSVGKIPLWQLFYSSIRECSGVGVQVQTSEERLGLLGELLFMRKTLVNDLGFGWRDALHFWKGPLCSPQDFVSSG